MEVQKVGRRSTQRQWQQRQQRRQQQLRLRSRARAALPRSRLNSRTRLCFLAGAAGRRRCPVPEGHPDAQVRPAARGWGEARAKVQGAAPRGAASPAVSPPPPSLPPTRPPATPRHATQVPNRARHRDQLGGHGAHLEAHVEAAAGGPPGGLLLAGGGGSWQACVGLGLLRGCSSSWGRGRRRGRRGILLQMPDARRRPLVLVSFGVALKPQPAIPAAQLRSGLAVWQPWRVVCGPRHLRSAWLWDSGGGAAAADADAGAGAPDLAPAWCRAGAPHTADGGAHEPQVQPGEDGRGGQQAGVGRGGGAGRRCPWWTESPGPHTPAACCSSQPGPARASQPDLAPCRLQGAPSPLQGNLLTGAFPSLSDHVRDL
jgi:hypothetical protein